MRARWGLLQCRSNGLLMRLRLALGIIDVVWLECRRGQRPVNALSTPGAPHGLTCRDRLVAACSIPANLRRGSMGIPPLSNQLTDAALPCRAARAQLFAPLLHEQLGAPAYCAGHWQLSNGAQPGSPYMRALPPGSDHQARVSKPPLFLPLALAPHIDDLATHWDRAPERLERAQRAARSEGPLKLCAVEKRLHLAPAGAAALSASLPREGGSSVSHALRLKAAPRLMGEQPAGGVELAGHRWLATVFLRENVSSLLYIANCGRSFGRQAAAVHLGHSSCCHWVCWGGVHHSGIA